MATEGDAYGASLNGTRSADGRFRSPAVFERALGGHWAQGEISGQRAFCEIFAQQNGVFQASKSYFFPKSAKQPFEGCARASLLKFFRKDLWCLCLEILVFFSSGLEWGSFCLRDPRSISFSGLWFDAR